MAGESTTSTLVGILHDAVVSKLVAPYAIDANPFLAHVRAEMLAPGTKVHSFPRVTKDTALSTTITEGTGLSNTALDFANADATVAEVGIMRQFTKLGERTNILGSAGLHAEAISDGVKMCLEKAETDLWAEASNASTSVGTSGAAFTIADASAAIAQAGINKCFAPLVFLFSGTQAKNIRADLSATAATVFANGNGNQLLSRTQQDGFMGELWGVPCYTNNLAESDGGANKIGLLMADGAIDPAHGATGMAVGWMPEVAQLPNITFSGGVQMAITMAYGIVEVLDYCYVGIVTVA